MQTQVEMSAEVANRLTSEELLSHGAQPRAIYLQTAPDPTFAMLHPAASGRSHATGVVLCPPFGWDDYCTHRVRRTWAVSLAEADHPTLRIDLPGTGDSGGRSRDPDRLQAWTSAVSAAASWLKDEAGCSRVCVVGIGFGGMLGWLAAAQGGPVDDLVLWGAPIQGRRLVRELRASTLSIDTHIRPDHPAARQSDPDPADDGILLDEGGQVTTPETIAALQAVDLRKIPLPDADGRHVLLLQRGANKADAEMIDHLRAAGVDLTIADGDGYDDLMRYVQESVVPHREIVRSVEWMSQTRRPVSPVRNLGLTRGAGVPAADSIQLVQDGVAIRETPISVNLPDGTMRGILTQPLVDTTGLCAAFFSGGSDRRIGPNRMWVETARRWAARGVTSVRIDPLGVGDSDGSERAWDQLARHYEQVHVERTVELLNALEQRGLPNRFVLVGFCSGAYRSVKTALVDTRVAGAFTVGLTFFRWTWWTVHVRDSWLAYWKPQAGDSALKIEFTQALQRLVKVVNAIQHSLVTAGQLVRTRPDRVMSTLNNQQTELLLVLKRSSYAYEQLSKPRRQARVRRLRRVQVECLPGDDTRFRPLALQRFLNDLLDAALTRVMRAEGVPARRSTTPQDELSDRRATRLDQAAGTERPDAAEQGAIAHYRGRVAQGR